MGEHLSEPEGTRPLPGVAADDRPGSHDEHRPHLRDEAGRAWSWVRGSLPRGDLRVLSVAVGAGGMNMVDAIRARWRRPRHWCPCCGSSFATFRHMPGSTGVSWNARCPVCDSSSRHRALVLLLGELVDPVATHRILHFAPEAQLVPTVRSLCPDAEYVTTDLFRGDVDRPGEDIQALSFADDSFDLVICNHVLEHVVDDDRAVRELSRVTARAGRALITVPGDWSRAETVSIDPERNNGHHRDYGSDATTWLEVRFGGCEVVLPRAGIGWDGPLSAGVLLDEPVFVCSGGRPT